MFVHPAGEPGRLGPGRLGLPPRIRQIRRDGLERGAPRPLRPALAPRSTVRSRAPCRSERGLRRRELLARLVERLADRLLLDPDRVELRQWSRARRGRDRLGAASSSARTASSSASVESRTPDDDDASARAASSSAPASLRKPVELRVAELLLPRATSRSSRETTSCSPSVSSFWSASPSSVFVLSSSAWVCRSSPVRSRGSSSSRRSAFSSSTLASAWAARAADS